MQADFQIFRNVLQTVGYRAAGCQDCNDWDRMKSEERVLQHPDLCLVIHWSGTLWVDGSAAMMCSRILTPRVWSSSASHWSSQLKDSYGIKYANICACSCMVCTATHSYSWVGGQRWLRCRPLLFLHKILQWNSQHQVNMVQEELPPPLSVEYVMNVGILLPVSAGGSGGVRSSVPLGHRSPGRPRAASSGGDGHVVENGVIGGRRGGRIRGVMPDHWEQAFSDPGEALDIKWVATWIKKTNRNSFDKYTNHALFTHQRDRVRGSLEGHSSD